MIVCEYCFKEFYTRGSEDYLNTWVAQVDRLAREGWEVLDSTRREGQPGLWTVVLARPAAEFRKPGNEEDSLSDSSEAGPS